MIATSPTTDCFMPIQKCLIQFGEGRFSWTPIWHPLLPAHGITNQLDQFEFLQDYVAQLPQSVLELLSRAACEEQAERSRNEEAGRGLVSERQWELIHVPAAGDPMFQ